MARRLVLALAAACVGAVLSQCGAKACDASNCATGCCDLSGTCHLGTDHWSCGGDGLACVTCAAGDKCNDSRVCETVVVVRPDAGPRDSGTADAGKADAGCRVVTMWPNQFKAGGYTSSVYDDSYASIYSGDPANPPQTGFDELYFEIYYPPDAGVVPPYSTNFVSTDTYAQCETCLTLFSGCTSAGLCDFNFFAQSGSATVTAATRNERAGVFKAVVGNVTLVEWDFGADQAVPDGQCVRVESGVWDVSWDAGSADGG